MINLLSQVKSVVDQATRLYQLATGTDRGWIVFFEARSFWLSLIGVIFTAIAMFGLPIPVPEEVVVEGVTHAIALAAFVWALVERLRGKKAVVWSPTQADNAIKQAEATAKIVKNVDKVKEIAETIKSFK